MFFSDADYELYRDLGQQCLEHGVAVWSCCLMPDHVHLIFVPDRAEARSVASLEGFATLTGSDPRPAKSVPKPAADSR